MKKINLIKRLWTDSHEKQSPQRFARYAAMLIMLLTLGVGQMWAVNTNFTKGETIFLKAGTNSAYRDGAKVKMWYNNNGTDKGAVWTSQLGSGSYNYTVVPNTGANKVQIQRFSSDGNTWWNSDGDVLQSGRSKDVYNVINSQSYGASWANQTFGFYLMGGSSGGSESTWSGTGYGMLSDDGDAKFTITCNVVAVATTMVFKIKDTDGTWYGSDHTLTGCVVGATYSVTADFYLNNVSYLALSKTQITFDVTASSADDDMGSVSPSSAWVGSSGVTFTAIPETGYHWTSWSSTGGASPSNAATSSVTATADGTITANFAETMSTVSFVASPTGKGTFQVGGATVTSTTAGVTTTRSVTAVPISGYRFTGWSISGGATISSTSTNPTTVTGKGAGADATLTATFEEDLTYYRLKFGACSGETSYGTVAAEDGSGDPLTSNTDYLSGTSVTVTATATDDDYKFDSWYNAWTSGSSVSTDNPLTFTLTAATNRYAHFVRKTTSITLNKNNGSGGTAGPVTATHGNTTLSTSPLVNPSRAGYTFTGYWTESSGGVKVIDTDGYLVASVSGYTKSGNKKWDYDDPTLTLYAQWTEKMTTVTVNVSPSGAGTLTVGGAAFTPGNTTTAGVATSRTVVATPTSGKVFHDWTVTGNATGSASTNTYTLEGNGNAGTGTLTANFGVASGWYMEGNDFGGWNRGTAAYQLTYSYREMDDVVYYPTTLTKDRYWKVNNGTTPYSISNSGSPAIVKGTIYPISEEWTKSTYASSTMSNVWVVVDKGTNKKLWVQDPQTFHNVNVTGADNDKGPVKVTLKTTSAFTKGDNVFETTQFANGETFTVTVTPVTGYIPTITIGGNTPVTWWKEQATYTADGTMSTSDITVTISYTASYAVTFAKTTGCGTLSAKGPGDVAISTGNKVKSGTSITFTQTSTHSGYDFQKWYSTSSGTSGTQWGTETSLTKSITAATSVYPIYTVHTYTGGTLDRKEGSSDGSYSVTYLATTMTPSAPSRTGYNVEGYYKETGRTTLIADPSGNLQKSTTYTDASNKWTYTSSIPTLYTQWAAKTYTAANNLDKGEGDTDGQFTATYDATSIAINTVPTKEGYHVEGYYDDDELTNKVATDGGVLQSNVEGFTTGTAWTKDANATLYTKWAPTVYTISFDGNKGSRVGTPSNIQANVTVTFDNNNFSAATVKVPVLAGYTFSGYYTAVDGGGVQIVDEEGAWIVPGSGEGNSYLDDSGNWVKAANTTLYAKWTANNYRVNFDANSGICGLSYMTVAMGATYGSGTEDGPLDGELPPASKYGYHFVGWYTLPSGGTEVTKDTQMATASEHTIYAHYEERTYVYFYNNLGWSKVFVTYDAYWDEYNNPSKGSGNLGKIYHEMTLVDGTTNIYRDEVPSSVLKSWKYFICFNDTKMLTGGMDVPTESGNYNNYNGGNAVFRHDFDSYATMFVPYQAKTDVHVYNTTNYYSTDWWTDETTVDDKKVATDYRHQKGYWMKYNSSDNRAGYAGYVIKGTWDGEQNDYYFKREKDTTVYSVTKYMDAGQTYSFRIYKHCTTTNTYTSWFTYNRGESAITSAACTDLLLGTNIAKSETSVKDKFTTTFAGDYTFKLTCDPNGTLKLSIVYPERTNDYFRVVYTWNDGSNHTRIYKTFKRIANGGDTWFEAFVHKSSAVNSRSLKLQRYNTSTSAWEDVEGKTFNLSECTKNGLYSFTMTRSSQDVITLRYVGPYTGTIYLRSDVTAGGWDYYNYASYGNSVMTYSDFSKHQTQNPYSHYYCVYVDNSTTNVAFTVATSNTPSICDTLVGDATIGAAAGGTPNYKALPASNPANIRFMYNDSLNTISRAYLKSAQGESVNKRFLVLHGDSKMFDSNGDAIAANPSRELAANELEFSDKGNWVYEINLKAEPVAKAKVIAKYNGSDRYLIGGSGDTSADWKTILGGDVTTTKYALAGTYDFKTNRLLLAWTPDGSDITANISDVDMLWVRHADNPATQIKFNGGSLTNISVVGAIQFRYDDLVGKVGSWNATTRPYLKYFVSFPFDVNVSNIFGLNEAEYGREYLIQKYNGAKRAKDGYFIGDGVSFWETLTTDSVMHANEGYCVSMDNDYLNYANGSFGNIWKNKTSGSSVYLYFPANNKMSITASDGKTTTAEAHLSTRDKEYESGGHKYNMKETDSHWNMVGAPYFSNAEVSSGPSAYYKWKTDNTWRPWLFTGDKGTEYEGVSNNFNAMSCIMVQYAGTITWNATTPEPLSAPRKRTEVEKNNLVALQLLQGEEQVDRAFIELKDGATAGFLLCEDLMKVFNNGRPNLYVHASEYATSYSQVPVESQIVSIGVDIYNSGVYTFSMPSNFNGTAVLIDKFAQTRTNLSLEDYEVSLDPGVIKDRFEVEININKVPTAIDGVTDGSGTLKDGKAHKFIMNDMMYILKDGVLYDARGNRVK